MSEPTYGQRVTPKRGAAGMMQSIWPAPPGDASCVVDPDEDDPMDDAAVIVDHNMPSAEPTVWLSDAKRIRDEAVTAERERIASVVELARQFTRCPIPGHNIVEGDSPRTRRIYCHDDQCENPLHVSQIRCDHPVHDLAEALAALDAAATADNDKDKETDQP